MENIENLYLESQIKFLKDSAIKFNPEIIDFEVLTEMRKGCNVIIVYAVTKSEICPITYRIGVFDSYSSKPNYFDGNVSDSKNFTLSDVKKTAIKFFLACANELKD